MKLLAELGASEIVALDIKKPDGPITSFIETDMGDAAAVAAAAAQIDGRVDVLFNNAGVSAVLGAEKVMCINWLGLRQLSVALLPKIPQGGAIVNTASIAGGQWPTHPDDVMEAIAVEGRDESLAWFKNHAELVGDGYAFSKECVQVYTMKSAKQTLACGVRTNSVCPAPIDTPLLPEFSASMTEKTINWTVEQCGGKIATPEDIAMPLAFLGSEAARYVNGVNLNIDRGFSSFMTTGQVDFTGLA